MIVALIFKEWKKTRWIIFGVIFVGLLIETYLFLRILRSARMVGMEHLWDVIVNRDTFLFSHLKYWAVVSGIALALAQFIPETINKRIKLSLHLPLPESQIIITMVGYGQLFLLAIFFFILTVVSIVASFYFPQQILYSILTTLLPWLFAGLVANSLMAWICLEPTWSRRIFNILLSTAIIQLFFLSDFPASYIRVLPYIGLVVLCVFPFVFLSVKRFKIGKQD